MVADNEDLPSGHVEAELVDGWESDKVVATDVPGAVAVEVEIWSTGNI